MAQQFDYPKTETQLREIQDALYQHSKEVYEAGGRPAFKGLLEIMSAESTIITAIHNIKGNHGSETPGVDSKTMRKDYLQKPFPWVVADIQRAFKYFEPQQIRRVYIDKPGKSEKRPLGIPAIRDRIVQECMRIVLEPILEAQFFAHSYGFRPMRDAAMALERVDIIMHNTGNYWIVEGDISKCFDRIDHSILIKRLYHMGIKDRRVLQIIKAMLKAGVMEERAVNEEGTPQGGLISPLLANVYLDIMDEWVVCAFECGIEYSTGRGNLQQCGMNIIKGFLAVSLFTVVPVRLYALSVSLQGNFSAGLTGYGRSIGEVGQDIITELNEIQTLSDVVNSSHFGLGIITSPIMLLFCVILMGYAVLKVFFANLKRGGILLIQIAVGSLYMFSVPRGYLDGFMGWMRQVIGLCLTAFLQSTILIAGLMVFKDHALMGVGLMLSAGEVPRIAGSFGVDTTTKANITSAVYTAQSAVNVTRTIAAAIK